MFVAYLDESIRSCTTETESNALARPTQHSGQPRPTHPPPDVKKQQRGRWSSYRAMENGTHPNTLPSTTSSSQIIKIECCHIFNVAREEAQLNETSVLEIGGKPNMEDGVEANTVTTAVNGQRQKSLSVAHTRTEACIFEGMQFILHEASCVSERPVNTTSNEDSRA